jgi:Ribbon-helix-helix protein, copG family
VAKKLGYVVGLRLTPDDVKKLDELSRRTFRGRSDIIRLLLSQADLRSTPDILLSPVLLAPDEKEAGGVSA